MSPGRSRSALSAALELAQAEDLRSPFRDAGPSLKRWLASEPSFQRARPWLAGQPTAEPAAVPTAVNTAVRTEAVGLAVEPLTVKEMEVLRHLADLLTTDEIADKMFVSVNTVRTHIRSVLRKLGVNRRNAAIRRARELGILPTQP